MWRRVEERGRKHTVAVTLEETLFISHNWSTFFHSISFCVFRSLLETIIVVSFSPLPQRGSCQKQNYSNKNFIFLVESGMLCVLHTTVLFLFFFYLPHVLPSTLLGNESVNRLICALPVVMSQRTPPTLTAWWQKPAAGVLDGERQNFKKCPECDSHPVPSLCLIAALWAVQRRRVSCQWQQQQRRSSWPKVSAPVEHSGSLLAFNQHWLFFPFLGQAERKTCARADPGTNPHLPRRYQLVLSWG